MSTTDEVILTTDVLGRVRTPATRREELLDEFKRRGMSEAKFAEFVGINYETFATRAQHRRRRKTTASPKPPGKAAAPKQLRWVKAVIEHGQISAESNRSVI